MTDFVPTLNELNDGFVVAINIEAKEGEADAIAAILRDLVQPTMVEPGVKIFLPYRSPANPSLFFIYELYVDEAGWEAHNNSGHFKAAVADLAPRAAKRERVPFVPFIGRS